MPLTVYSTVAPLEQVWAFGWFINRLLSGRPSRLALIGSWAIALPSLLSMAALVLSIVAEPSILSSGSGLGYLSPTLLFQILYLMLVVRVTHAYFHFRGSSAPTSQDQGQVT
jgi:hypothetical protein